jgi:hypothetical protein
MAPGGRPRLNALRPPNEKKAMLAVINICVYHPIRWYAVMHLLQLSKMNEQAI